MRGYGRAVLCQGNARFHKWNKYIVGGKQPDGHREHAPAPARASKDELRRDIKWTPKPTAEVLWFRDSDFICNWATNSRLLESGWVKTPVVWGMGWIDQPVISWFRTAIYSAEPRFLSDEGILPNIMIGEFVIFDWEDIVTPWVRRSWFYFWVMI